MRERVSYFNYFCFLFLGASLVLGSCTQQAPRKRGSAGSLDLEENSTEGQESEAPPIELRHFLNPRTGNFTKKITLPQNFSGELYISGLNLGALHDGHVFVQMHFGHTRKALPLIPATVATAPGITPNTKTEVLVLDLANSPFQDLSLRYQLFDYQSYDFDTGLSGSTSSPIVDNKNPSLFCRGLKLQNDPTFTGNLEKGCREEGERCLYAYAKIEDTASSGSPVENPYLEYSEDTDQSSTIVNNCQSERSPGAFVNLDRDEWQIDGDAVFGANGIYRSRGDQSSLVDEAGLQANLFPRYGKLELGAGVSYRGSDLASGEKQEQQMQQAGESLWIDGCNLRAMSVSEQTGYTQSSCNVTASLEVLKMDKKGDMHLIAGRAEGGDELKIQIVRRELTDYQGQNVLSSNFRSCSSTSTCGENSCCFNGRCWSKDIVSFCKEDFGLGSDSGKNIGQSCSNDLQCASLCCNGGACDTHTNYSPGNEEFESMLCGKAEGESCLSREFCGTTSMHQCTLSFQAVESEDDQELNDQYRCFVECNDEPIERHHDCTNGVCDENNEALLSLYNRISSENRSVFASGPVFTRTELRDGSSPDFAACDNLRLGVSGDGVQSGFQQGTTFFAPP